MFGGDIPFGLFSPVLEEFNPYEKTALIDCLGIGNRGPGRNDTDTLINCRQSEVVLAVIYGHIAREDKLTGQNTNNVFHTRLIPISKSCNSQFSFLNQQNKFDTFHYVSRQTHMQNVQTPLYDDCHPISELRNIVAKTRSPVLLFTKSLYSLLFPDFVGLFVVVKLFASWAKTTLDSTEILGRDTSLALEPSDIVLLFQLQLRSKP